MYIHEGVVRGFDQVLGSEEGKKSEKESEKGKVYVCVRERVNRAREKTPPTDRKNKKKNLL